MATWDTAGGSKHAHAAAVHVPHKPADVKARRVHSPLPRRFGQRTGPAFLACVSAVFVMCHVSMASGFAPNFCFTAVSSPRSTVAKCSGATRALRGRRPLTLRMQFDAERGADQVLQDITQGVNKFVFVRGMDQEAAAEMRAIVLVAGRGYKRRLGSGAPVESLDRVREDLHGMVRAQLVDIEQLITDEEWDNVISGFKQSQDVPEHMKEATGDMEFTRQQLRRLFPNASPIEVEEAARKGTTLENAVQLVMDSAWAPASDAQMPLRPPAPRKPRTMPPPGVRQRLASARANSGASAFGLVFDLQATTSPLQVTGIGVACSPLQAFSPVKQLRLAVYSTEGSGEGKEEAGAAWELLAEDPDAQLPAGSWMDLAPAYGHVTFDSPLLLQPGERRGVCVRTSSLSGLVVRMNDGKGGDTDGMDEDFGGGASDDDIAGITARAFRAGEVSDDDVALWVHAGWTTSGARFDQEPACQPVVAAFVGEILYSVLPEPA